ncbi:MAG TPA: hypothetical protein VF651_06625 [Gammaproteobacteria bacterium]
MVTLGVDQDGADVYEGASWLHAIYPPPILTPITITKLGGKIEPSMALYVMQAEYVFREDSFDPTSRIKRGRIYRRDNTQPHNCSVYPHPARATEYLTSRSGNGIFMKSLVVFYQHQVAHELKVTPAVQALAVLGTSSAYSLWLIVDIERIHTNEDLLTLRSIRSSSSLPNLKIDSLPAHGKSKLVQATEKLALDINKAAPESVIDRTRDLMVVALTSYLEEKGLDVAGLDLGQLIKKFDGLPAQDQRHIAENAGKIIARLHARAKPSERGKRPLRNIMEQDAELAVSCAAVTLCDFNWAEWN